MLADPFRIIARRRFRRAFPSLFSPYLRRAQAYSDKLLALAPVTYWPLWEASGSTAHDISGNNCHAAYSAGITLGHPGIGDGNTCAYFNGTTSYVNLYSTLFNSLLNRQAGTFMLWAKVAAASFWSDGADHFFWMIYSNESVKYFMANKYSSTNNNIRFKYHPATTTESNKSTTSIDWMHLALSWNIPSSRWRVYYNGAKTFDDGGTVGPIGSGLDPGRCLIGASAFNLGCFYGYMAHAALFDVELTPEQVLSLSSV